MFLPVGNKYHPPIKTSKVKAAIHHFLPFSFPIIEAVKATNLSEVTDTRTLILPQLSAGGVAIPQLPKSSEEFPFNVKYGPVWSKHLPQYLEEKPAQKDDKMKLAKFSLFTETA